MQSQLFQSYANPCKKMDGGWEADSSERNARRGSPTATCSPFPLTEVAKAARAATRVHILERWLRPEFALGHAVERFGPSLSPSYIQRSRALQAILKRLAG